MSAEARYPQLDVDRWKTYRAVTFHTAPGTRLTSLNQAVDFVNQRRFVLFWPNKGTDIPSLWIGAAGDRPVPDEHDDPGHVTWGWKDGSLSQKVWYYARLLRRRNAFISLEAAPYFYALTPNYGEPETDYLDQYQQGLLTAEAKAIFDALLFQGPLDTISLRRAANLIGTASDTRFNRALDSLQIEMKVLPVGISPVGAWKYAFIYQLTHRQFPELINQVQQITEAQARVKLAGWYLQSIGAAPLTALTRLFGWHSAQVQIVWQELIRAHEIIQIEPPSGSSGEWYALPDLAG